MVGLEEGAQLVGGMEAMGGRRQLVGLKFGHQFVVVDGAQQFVGTVIGGRIERHGVVKDPLRFLFLEIRSLGEQRKIGKG